MRKLIGTSDLLHRPCVPVPPEPIFRERVKRPGNRNSAIKRKMRRHARANPPMTDPCQQRSALPAGRHAHTSCPAADACTTVARARAARATVPSSWRPAVGPFLGPSSLGRGVTEVTRRAGHGVAVLVKIYAHCIDEQADAASKRITDALRRPEAEQDPGDDGGGDSARNRPVCSRATTSREPRGGRRPAVGRSTRAYVLQSGEPCRTGPHRRDRLHHDTS